MFPSPLDRLGLQPAMDQTSHRRFMKLLRVRSSFFLSFHSQSGYTGKKESEKFYSINVSARFIIWYVTIRYQLESSVKRVTDHHTLEWTAIPWRNFVVKR